MKPFKVKWGFLKRFYQKTFSSGDSLTNIPLKFYFESEYSLLLFLSLGGTQIYSELSLSEISLKDFKLEFLSDAEQLLDNPLNQSYRMVME